MRNFDERKAEILRRSARIDARRKQKRRIVLLCALAAALVTLAALGTVAALRKRPRGPRQDPSPAQDIVIPNTGESLSGSGIEPEIPGNTGTESLTVFDSSQESEPSEHAPSDPTETPTAPSDPEKNFPLTVSDPAGILADMPRSAARGQEVKVCVKPVYNGKVTVFYSYEVVMENGETLSVEAVAERSPRQREDGAAVYVFKMPSAPVRVHVDWTVWEPDKETARET